MNILNKVLGILCITALSLSTANADSSNFKGIYAGIGMSMNGVALSGDYKDTSGSADTNSKGSLGIVEPSVSYELGYNLALGDTLFISFGASQTPVDTTVDANNVTNSKKVTAKISDLTSYYIEPSIAITSNSALYFKVASVEGDFTATGNDIVAGTTKIGDLDGDTFAFGTKIVTDGGIYIKAEAGMTEFDTIKITGISDDAGGSTATSNIQTELAYGQLTLGLIF